eukprot:g3838.t1
MVIYCCPFAHFAGLPKQKILVLADLYDKKWTSFHRSSSPEVRDFHMWFLFLGFCGRKVVNRTGRTILSTYSNRFKYLKQ